MNNWHYEILLALTVLYYLPEAYIHYVLFHVKQFDDIGGRKHWAFGLTSAVTHLLQTLPAIIIIGLNVWQIILLGCMYAITRATFHDGFYNLFRHQNFFYTGTNQTQKFGYDFDAIWIWFEQNGINPGTVKVVFLLVIAVVYKVV